MLDKLLFLLCCKSGKRLQWSLILLATLGFSSLSLSTLKAQTLPGTPIIPNPAITPSPSLEPPRPLPPPEDLLQFPIPTEPAPQQPLNLPGSITVSRFEIVGSTVFSPETLAATTAKFLGRPLTFTELTQAASAITQLYLDNGYLTSGAFIPADQSFQGGIVRIQVSEGSLEEIQVKGNQRLNPGYVQSRLAVGAGNPLNVNRLLEALQLLQLNPLFRSVSAELSASPNPGKSILTVTVAEADTFNTELRFENNRSPSTGSEKRQIQATEGNLLGLGDTLSVAYANTDGSDAVDASYTIPFNPYNGTIRLGFSTTSSRVIQAPFTVLDINSSSRSYEITLRQPIIQTPSQELALGLSGNRRESESFLLGIPFPLAAGADDRGNTRISALRFFQEFTNRGSSEVLALRSQFSVGLDAFGATINDFGPDSRFFAWRGQAQYVRLLAPETLLLLRSDLQVAGGPLVPLEQFGLGGQDTVRGYRQDILLTDNGAFASAELRIPVLRVPEISGVLQVTPFIDFGTGWNNGGDSAIGSIGSNTLLSGGLGLLWRQADYLTARLDWGIPFISVNSSRNTWQENGIHFSIVYSPF